MNYVIVIHKDAESDYGVIVPDLPGCFSAGSTLDEAVENAKEAIECHLEGLLKDNESISKPLSLEFHQHNEDYQNGIWALVSVDYPSLAAIG